MKPSDDKKIDKILRSIGQFCKPKPDFEKWCSQNPQAVNALKTQAGKNTEEKQNQLRSKFIKSPIIKLAAAAVLIFVFAVAVYFSIVPNPKVTISDVAPRIIIPAELAQLSTDELLKLYYEPSKSPFDVNTIKAALQQSLDKISPEEVIQIAKNLTGKKNVMSGGRRSAVCELAQPISDFSGSGRKAFPEIVKSSNLVIGGRLISIKMNVDDIKQALLDRQRFRFVFREGYLRRFRVTVQLDVNDTLPKDSLKAGEILTIPAVLWEDQLAGLKKNTKYIFAMVKDEGQKPRFLDDFSGIYPVDNNPASKELWRFFSDSQKILIFGNEPNKETTDYWLSRLNSDTYLLALEYMDILPDKLLPGSAIMDAVELRYKDLISQTNRSEKLRIGNALFERVSKMLLRVNDKDSIRRMLSLFDVDSKLATDSLIWQRIHTGGNNILALLIQLNAASGDENKGQRLVEAYKKYKDRPLALGTSSRPNYISEQQARFAKNLLDEIINQAAAISDADFESFLMEILKEPSVYGLYDAPTFEKIWKILAAGNYDIRAYLENFLAEPNLSDINVHPPPDKNYYEYSRFAFEQSAYKTLLSLPDSKGLRGRICSPF